jgi:hypothetical protein
MSQDECVASAIQFSLDIHGMMDSGVRVVKQGRIESVGTYAFSHSAPISLARDTLVQPQGDKVTLSINAEHTARIRMQI